MSPSHPFVCTHTSKCSFLHFLPVPNSVELESREAVIRGALHCSYQNGTVSWKQLIHSKNGITLRGVQPIAKATLFLVFVINLAMDSAKINKKTSTRSHCREVISVVIVDRIRTGGLRLRQCHQPGVSFNMPK